MKLIKSAGITQVKMSKKEWENIGKTAGWMEEYSKIDPSEMDWTSFENEWSNWVNGVHNVSKDELNRIKEYMKSAIGRYTDQKNSSVIQTIPLAENTAKQLGHPEWITDEDNDIWDVASMISEAWYNASQSQFDKKLNKDIGL
jgi:hypothetical protein